MARRDAVVGGRGSPERPGQGRAARRSGGQLWSSVEPRGKEGKGEGRAKTIRPGHPGGLSGAGAEERARGSRAGAVEQRRGARGRAAW